MRKGERQVANTLKKVRRDHIERYNLVLKSIKSTDIVLDIACGIGYGSYLIAKQAKAFKVTGIDKSASAIRTGKKFYNSKNILYLKSDIFEVEKIIKEKFFDVIVTIETLEHLKHDKAYLKLLHKLLKLNGTLFISTPNEDVMPYDKKSFPFHERHYSTQEFVALLNSLGFFITQAFSQVDYHVLNGFGGWINIAVCRKQDKKMRKQQPDRFKKTYSSLLKEASQRKLEKDFIRLESDRLFKLGRDKEFWFLNKKWLKFEKAHPLYLRGFFWERRGIDRYAIRYFRRASLLKVDAKNKAFIVSSLFHLAQLYKRRDLKIKALKKCLRLAPNHQGAKKLLKSLI